MSNQLQSHVVYRQSDQEKMGIITSDDGSSWTPRTIFGYPLAAPMARAEAVRFLESNGLELLLDGWQFYDDDDWYNCVIVEASPETLTIKISDFGHPDIYQSRTIAHPTEQSIRRR